MAASETDPPLISVVIRSTDRPTLPAALASIAAQDYPRVEVVVAAASGPTHPALPSTCGPWPLRLVPSATKLSRPGAANAGLDATTGQWITYLDDDDIFMPTHLSGLMAARAQAPQARVVYCRARGVFKDGHVERFGQPYCLVQLYARNYMQLSMAVFDRWLVDDGCRFDEEMLLHEDWDLCLQFAQRGPFHFVPRETFQWNADIGSSGGGGGINHHDDTFTTFRDRMYAKWGAQRDALIDRVEPMLKGAAELLRDGQLGAAEARCREVLAVSPNDPWALNLLAQIQRITGRLQEAGRTQQLAVAVAPHDPTLTVNLGLLYRAQGEIDMARRCADRALVLDANFGPAIRLRAELAA